MKYKWNITFITKSGKEIKGICETEKTSSLEVAEELFPENSTKGIGCIWTEDGKGSLFYRQEEVAAFKISIPNSNGSAL